MYFHDWGGAAYRVFALRFTLYVEGPIFMCSVTGYEKCVLVGHDWGGAVCWAFALQCPRYLESLIILNAPHPKVFLQHMNTHWSQFRKSW